MNEDFYYIEVFHKLAPSGRWLAYGYLHKWYLDECMEEALRRKKTHPHQKLRICRHIVTRTEWKNRKSLK